MRTSHPLELIPEESNAPLRIEDIFQRRARLEIDVGCGRGTFLTEMAARYPERDFLGIERLLKRTQIVCRRAAREGLGNVRVIRTENRLAVESLFAPGSVSVFHILFPDPWPKRRHHVRRLMNEPFLRQLARALEPGGELRFRSDFDEYFEKVRALIKRGDFFREIDWGDDVDYPQSDFERRFRAQGLPIYSLRAVKA